MKKIVLLLTLMLCTTSLNAYSSQKNIRKARLAKGQAAPFPGTLLTNEALATIITNHKLQLKTLEAKHMRKQKEAQARYEALQKEMRTRVQAEKNKAKIAATSCKKQKQIYARSLNAIRNPPFHKHPAFNFTAGCLLCAGACVGTAAIVSR